MPLRHIGTMFPLSSYMADISSRKGLLGSTICLKDCTHQILITLIDGTIVDRGVTSSKVSTVLEQQPRYSGISNSEIELCMSMIVQ
jgi:hypothetical protein